MRLLEGIIFFMFFFTTVLVLIGDFKRIKIAKYLSILGFVIFVVHLFIEGGRWQLYPLYLIIIIYFIVSIIKFTGRFNAYRLNSHKITKGFILGLMILFLLVSAMSAYAFPVYKMAMPKGNFKIGTVAFDLIDENRKAIYSDNLKDNRKIKLQVWY